MQQFPFWWKNWLHKRLYNKEVREMDLAEYKGVYVIAEEFEGKLRNVTLELLGQGKQLA